MNRNHDTADDNTRDDNIRDDSAQRFARLLDSGIRLPGGLRVGLDGLLGLVPVVGDMLGAGLSFWLLYHAYQRGAPLLLLLRMLGNILVDALIGSIPFIGDLFDFFWKANERNAALLQEFLVSQENQESQEYQVNHKE